MSSRVGPAIAARDYRARVLRRPRAVEVMLLVTVSVWALNFTVTRYALTHGWEPLAYSALRYASGALLFAAFTAGTERSLRVGRRRDLVLLLGAAAVGVFLNQVAYVYAIKLTNATTVALILGVTPVFTALVAFAVGLERMTRRFWLAAAVSFLGVALVALGAGEGGFHVDVTGDLLALATAATWAAYSVVVAPLIRRYSPYRISAIVLVAGTAPLVVLAARQLRDQDYGALGGPAWAAIVFATLGPLVLTNVLWFRAINIVGPSRATLFANIQPFLAAVLAMLILSERLTALQLAGGVAIGAGILLARRRRPARPAVESPA
jgi:drug/metabolite transporter (DMT)-like permease